MDISLQQLVDERAIEQVLYRYATCCDRRQWELLDEIFVEDVRCDYGGEIQLSSRQELQDMLPSMLGGCGPTQHLMSNFRIEVDGDSATCACYMRAHHEGIGEQRGVYFEVWGEYRDTLVRTAQGWRIVERRLEAFNETGSREVLGPAG